MDERHSIQWQVHYFDVGIKVVHEWGVAWSIVEQEENVEWDVLLQAVFLYPRDKVVEKPVLENGLCNPALELLFHKTGREHLAMFLRALGFSE